MINSIFTSRRDMPHLCRYWKQDETEYYDKNEIGYKKKAEGEFYAKEVSSQQNSSQVVGGVFMFDNNTVSLKTNDDIENMRKNDIVEYNEEFWRVIDIQKKPIRKNSQFMKRQIYTYYISLKR